VIADIRYVRDIHYATVAEFEESLRNRAPLRKDHARRLGRTGGPADSATG
jgi:hypothetical protein